MNVFVALSRLRALPLVASLAALPAVCHGIIERDDVADRLYIEAGKHYPAVTDFNGGTCTLIAPQWALTAAHVAADWNPFDSRVIFNGKRYEIDKVIVHPVFLEKGLRSGADFALIKLKEPVEGVAPVKLYGGTDEIGKEITIVGAGETGNGKTGPSHDDAVKRAANNIVTGVRGGFLTFIFDAPPKALPLEGISGPGDSGGPALLNVDGQLYTIGVSTANASQPGRECRYGSTEMYARVSDGKAWLEETMKADPPGTAKWSAPLLASDWKWNDSVESTSLRDYLIAFNTSSADEVEKFNKSHRSQRYLNDSTPAGRTQRARELIDQFGTLTLEKVATGPDHALAALLRSSKTGGELFIRVRLERDGPPVLQGFVMQELP